MIYFLGWFAVAIVVALVLGALLRCASRDDEMLKRLRKSGGI